MPKLVHSVRTSHKIVATVRVATYDVWGNAENGYEVNDKYDQGTQEVVLDLEISNVEASPEGESLSFSREIVHTYCLTDDQLRELLDIDQEIEIEVDGDDRSHYVNLAEDWYPVGEVYIESWRAFDANAED